MPAALPGSTPAQNAANPTLGMPVALDLLSGPKGSPLDKDMTGNASTGALSTGVGFGPNMRGDGFVPGVGNTLKANYIPGVTKPDGTAATDSTLMYIGGGRSNPDGTPKPYTTGFGIGFAGSGGARDGGAGPAFTGFTGKIVAAAANVAAGAVVATGFNNRSGVALAKDNSQLAVATAASAAVA